jgi:nifR3 family TIM-barrel protein
MKMELKLGSLVLESPFFQAAISGYSDYAMRKLARRFGAPLVFAGVILAKSAANPKAARKGLYRPSDDEHPIGTQILGNEPKEMADAAAALEGVGFDIIDLNFACPAPKVLRRGRGGALLNEPDKVMKIFLAVRQAVKCPVIMKLRMGFCDGQKSRDNFWQIAKQASEAGVDGLIIHGRSVIKRFSGKADWNILAEAKEKLARCKIIGSGDLFDAEQAVQILRQSGIDGLTIARGAIGNPWIFREIKSILEGKKMPQPPSLKEQGEVMLEHFEEILKLYDARKAVGCFRKFALRYSKLHPSRKKVQLEIFAAQTPQEVKDKINIFYK